MYTIQYRKALQQLGFNDAQVDFILRHECHEDFPDETPKDIAKRVIEDLTEEYRLALSFFDN